MNESYIHAAIGEENVYKINFILDRDPGFLEYSTNGMTPLLFACEIGNVTIVKLLIDRGANLHAYCNQNKGVIHYSVSSPRVLDFLLRLGINIDARNHNGNGLTALQALADTAISPNTFRLCDEYKLFRRLLTRGARLCLRTNEGLDSVDLAKKHADITVLWTNDKGYIQIYTDMSRLRIEMWMWKWFEGSHKQLRSLIISFIE